MSARVSYIWSKLLGDITTCRMKGDACRRIRRGNQRLRAAAMARALEIVNLPRPSSSRTRNRAGARSKDEITVTTVAEIGLSQLYSMCVRKIVLQNSGLS